MLAIVGILLIFGLVIRHAWKNAEAKKDEILRLVAVTSEEEAEVAKLQAVEEYNSLSQPLPQLDQRYCAVCYCPTTTRCSQCKAVRYCSAKCQIIHWRQGHKDNCRPAVPLCASKESKSFVETPSENQFAMDLDDKAKIHSDPSQEFDDSGSSSSSSNRFFSSTERSETSFDTSISEVIGSGSPNRPDKALSVSTDSHASQSTCGSDDSDVLSPSPFACSINNTHWDNKLEEVATKNDKSLKSKGYKDKRKGAGSAVLEEFVLGTAELRSSQSSSSGIISLAEDSKNQLQPATSKVMRSVSVRPVENHQMPSVELSSKCSKSLKVSPSDEFWQNESRLPNGKETRSRSAGICQKMSAITESQNAISLEPEGVPIISPIAGKGLKTSVRRFVQQFREPKLSKPHTLDMGKDSGRNYNHKVIFPLKLFMQLYSCDDFELHPFGLLNCGNSCYANAVLQCLTFTRPIASYLLRGLHSKSCRKRDWCFICKFERLIQMGQETNYPLSPIGLVSQIQTIGREEDAHEFLRNVVDKMQSVCLEEAGVSGSLAEDSTLVGWTFGGYLRSKVKCLKCLERSERCDRMMDLTVEIDGNIHTLEAALLQFTSSETLGGDDKYKCSRCKSYERAKKKLSVLEAPNILTIVLKRFRSGNLEKLNKLVQFPEVLNLTPYMGGMSDKYATYHLYAVVVHLGLANAANSGHYISYVKNFRGDWFRIDDSRVSPVGLDTVLSVEAYILFYARHTPRGASFVSNSTDGKTRRNMEAISSSNTSKKKNIKMKPSSHGWRTEPEKHPHSMSSNDFTGNHIQEPEDWRFYPMHRNPTLDSLSDSSSIFSTSDAGSYSTDSTKDSSADDISGYIFGSNWYRP